MHVSSARFRGSLPYSAGFACVLALVATILIRSLRKAWHAPDSDEGYYAYFAYQVQQHGLRIFPKLFRAWNSNGIITVPALERPSWWHPPPYRLGYIIACGWWAKLFGASIASLSALSTASHLVWMCINWFFARRRLGEGFALALVCLCAFSPLLMGEARLALMDNYTLMWTTLVTWLFLEMLESPHAGRLQIGFVLAFLSAILTKELSVFLVAPLAAVTLIERFGRGRPLPLWRFAALFALPGLLSIPFFVLAAGGLPTLL
ncbi:MAG TPA: glycosyltransferase family 39 protein, partial [Polyangiaceae bacterium]|nr:glycosyltransferase family 39 protein [Polyangiaceae bacterium]